MRIVLYIHIRVYIAYMCNLCFCFDSQSPIHAEAVSWSPLDICTHDWLIFISFNSTSMFITLVLWLPFTWKYTVLYICLPIDYSTEQKVFRCTVHATISLTSFRCVAFVWFEISRIFIAYHSCASFGVFTAAHSIVIAISTSTRIVCIWEESCISSHHIESLVSIVRVFR